MSSCDFSTKIHETKRGQWLVEEDAFKPFIEQPEDSHFWQTRNFSLWIPDAYNPSLAYIYGYEIDDTARQVGVPAVGIVKINPNAVSSKMKFNWGPIEKDDENNDNCCLNRTAYVISHNTHFGMVTRIHALGDNVEPDFPDIQDKVAYIPRSAEKGVVRSIAGQEIGDDLTAAGVLVNQYGIQVLWQDADGKPRGWEKVNSLSELSETRTAIKNFAMYAKGPDFDAFVGFAKPQGLEELVSRIRKSSLSASLMNF